MIDWTKPIETVENVREAKIIGRSPHATCGTGFIPMVVWVSPQIPGCVGNVFLVNNEGIRCDDRTVYSGRQEPIIRNVKVKKEGWVLMRPPPPGALIRLSGLLATNHAYPSEKEAREAMDYYSVEPGTKPVYLTWEE
jgi:hypothetical protein